MSNLNVGDLVIIDTSNEGWSHLIEKEEHHPLKRQGVVIEVKPNGYAVRFGKWLAYLKSEDLIKLVDESES